MATSKLILAQVLLIVICVRISQCQMQEPPSVYLSLRETNYFINNSYILITDIGALDQTARNRTREDSLACNTNLTQCCQAQGVGHWLFPNGSRIRNFLKKPGGIYRNRGPQFVGLNRINNTTEPTGQYCCEVPNSMNEIITFCANIVTTIPTSPTSTTSLAITQTTVTMATASKTPETKCKLEQAAVLVAGGVAAGVVITILMNVFCITVYCVVRRCRARHKSVSENLSQQSQRGQRGHTQLDAYDTIRRPSGDSQTTMYDYPDREVVEFVRGNGRRDDFDVTKNAAYGRFDQSDDTETNYYI